MEIQDGIVRHTNNFNYAILWAATLPYFGLASQKQHFRGMVLGGLPLGEIAKEVPTAQLEDSKASDCCLRREGFTILISGWLTPRRRCAR